MLLFATVLAVISLTIQTAASQPSTFFTPSLIVPEPGATDVPLNTSIVISWNALPPIQELHLTPDVPIAEVTNTSNPATSTFRLAEQLTPSTTYNVTITYGSNLTVFSSLGNKTWSFTTVKPPTTPTPSVFDDLLAVINDLYDIVREHIWLVIIGIIVIIVTIVVIASAPKLRPPEIRERITTRSLEGAQRREPTQFYHNPHKNYLYSYKGAIHTHSIRSSWVRPPFAITELEDPLHVFRDYAEKGCRFIFLTDHNNVSIPYPEGGEPIYDILYFRYHKSLECGQSYGHHILALGIDPARIDQFHRENPDRGKKLDPDKNGEVNWHTRWCGNVFGRLEYYNYIGMAVLAHPWDEHGHHMLQLGWALSELLDNRNSYTGIEIFDAASTRSVIEDSYAQGAGLRLDGEHLWDQALEKGRRVWGFAGDDCHNTDNNSKSFNRGWIVVNSAKPFENNQAMEYDIIDNIKAGNFLTVVRSPLTTGNTPSDGPAGDGISTFENRIRNAITISTIGDEIRVSTDRPSYIRFRVCPEDGYGIIPWYEHVPDNRERTVTSAIFKASRSHMWHPANVPIKYVRVVIEQERDGELYWVFSQPLFVLRGASI